MWDFAGVISGKRGRRVLVQGDMMPGARFFPDVRINFAENLLRGNPEGDAIVFWGEDKVKRRLTHRELREAVSRMQQALVKAGLKEGDRVAAFMPNMPETVIAMLATTSLGGTFTSCSPDFGVQGVLDRFGQVEPTVFFACDGYFYNGKTIDTLPRITEIVKDLPTVKQVVIVPYVGSKSPLPPRGVRIDDFVAPFKAKESSYHRVPFNSPLILTRAARRTFEVHHHGGRCAPHAPQGYLLHCDVKPGDRVFTSRRAADDVEPVPARGRRHLLFTTAHRSWDAATSSSTMRRPRA
jgi:acetoacetyl-CoA synthetase